MRVVRFLPAHIEMMANYGGQEHLIGCASSRELQDVADRGLSFAALADDHTVIGCGGLVEVTRYRATAWAVFSRSTPQRFVALHRAASAVLYGSGFARIEAYVNPADPAAMRWIAMLGFVMERAWQPLFFPDGAGASQWALYPKG